MTAFICGLIVGAALGICVIGIFRVSAEEPRDVNRAGKLEFWV